MLNDSQIKLSELSSVAH